MTTTTAGEQEVMDVLDRWSAALRDKDLDALAECYADDVSVFDINAQLSGYDQLRDAWTACFPYFPNPIECERKDMQMTVGPTVASLAFLCRMSGMAETDHPSAKSWFRSTVCMAKITGAWKIIHEHGSLPFDCGSGEPSYILDD